MAKAKIPPPTNDSQAPPESNTTQPPNGDETLTEGVQNVSTVTSTTDSTRGSLSNISTPSIKRGDNDGDDDSSAFDSSSDTECDDDSIKRAIDRIPGALAPGEACVVQNGALVVGPEAMNPRLRSPQHAPSAGTPSIGSIALQNSSDITFGNKTYIKGQVVIKNIYKDRGNGLTNDGYQVHENDSTDSASGKKVPPTAAPPEPRTWQSSLKGIIKDKPLLSFIVMISLMIVLCAIIAVISILTASGKGRIRPPVGDGDDDRANVPQDTHIEDDLFPGPRPLRLVTRQEWVAQPPREPLTDLKLPVSNVIIAHTATESCTNQGACIFRVRFIQLFHMDSINYDDISYNFLIGGDNRIYEGRGWKKIGAHTRGHNNNCEGIAFVGEYNFTDQPTEEQMDLLNQLLEYGVSKGYITENYKIYASEHFDDASPTGKSLIEALQKLPQFVNITNETHPAYTKVQLY
ncbi:peptidoglycan-recognition protein LC-like isoform X3 [Anopheles coustani]|nr:peptidoglycan-recognition protein LC-like isoform X3 [Anopheles coustani]